MRKAMMFIGFALMPMFCSAPPVLARSDVYLRTPLAYISPATSSSNVTIAAAGTGIKNCIADVDVISSSTFTFRMLDGGTTFYQMNSLPAGGGLVRSWDIDSAPCSSANTALTLKVDNGTFQINYDGYTR